MEHLYFKLFFFVQFFLYQIHINFVFGQEIHINLFHQR